MKNKLYLLGIMTALVFGLSINVYAAGADETVTLTSDDKLEYSNGGSLGSSLEGMAPGQKKEITIDIKNSNPNKADFFVKTADIEALEKSCTAAGGAYEIKLDLVNGSNITPLYNSELGGSSGDQGGAIGKTTGIEEMTNLNENTYLATLSNGDVVQLVLQFTMDGESVTNANARDYSNALGQLGFQFMAAYDTPEARVIVQKKDNVTYQTGEAKRNVVTTVRNVVIAVKTGDSAVILPMIILLIAGIGIYVAADRKQKKEQSNHEK